MALTAFAFRLTERTKDTERTMVDSSCNRFEPTDIGGYRNCVAKGGKETGLGNNKNLPLLYLRLLPLSSTHAVEKY